MFQLSTSVVLVLDLHELQTCNHAFLNQTTTLFFTNVEICVFREYLLRKKIILHVKILFLETYRSHRWIIFLSFLQ
jgi:hypothetical protein